MTGHLSLAVTPFHPDPSTLPLTDTCLSLPSHAPLRPGIHPQTWGILDTVLTDLTAGHRARKRMKTLPRVRVEGKNTTTNVLLPPLLLLLTTSTTSTPVLAQAHYRWWAYYYPVLQIVNPSTEVVIFPKSKCSWHSRNYRERCGTCTSLWGTPLIQSGSRAGGISKQ